MDNLKLIGKTEEELLKELQVVRTFSDDIHMEFGLHRSAKIVLKTGKLVHLQNSILDFNREIQELEQGNTYKCVGNGESEGMQHRQMKERMKKEYARRLRIIMKSDLNAKNRITAIGALAVPVLRYSFGIINWRLEEIRKMGKNARKVQTVYKNASPKS
jgi:hypothetical protein